MKNRWFTICLCLFVAALLGPGASGAATFKDVYSYINAHRNYEALQKLQEIVPDQKDIPLYYFLKGKALMGIKKYPEAIDYLNRAYIMARHRTLKEDALFERGMAYFRQGFYYEAAANFKNFLQNFPDSHYKEEATIHYAQALIKIKDFVRALAMFRQLPEDRPETIFGKAEVFQKLGLYRSANALYTRGFISYREYLKNNPYILYSYTENLVMIGRYKKAKTLLYSLIETPLRYKAYIALGLIEYRKKNFSLALNYFKKAVNVADRRSRRKAMLYAARSLIRLGRKRDARVYLHRIVKEFPYTVETEKATLLLSRLYREEGEYLKASRFLNELLFAKAPDRATLTELKLLVLESSRSDRKAFLSIWKKSGLWLFSPEFEDLLLEIAGGFVDNNDGDFLRIYNFLMKEGSRRARVEAICNMIVFYSEMEAKEKASALIKKLKGIRKDNDSILRAYAWYAYLKGKRRKAYARLARIKRARKRDLALLIKLKDDVASVPSFEKTYKRFCRATSTRPDYEMLGDLYFQRGEKERAIKLYRLALNIRNDDQRLLFKIGFFDNKPDFLRRVASSQGLYSRASSVTLQEMQIINKLRSL